ncbi:MAG: glycosyltransferase family 2 protein, partial [Cytophagaceae bacterium]
MKNWLEKKIVRAKTPSPGEVVTLRFLIGCGLFFMGLFLWWFFSESRIGYAPLYYILTTVMFYKLLKMLHEWYHYYNISIPDRPVPDKQWKVDMLTTFCPGEPYDMIVSTLEAMVAVKYPHKTYLCDEADDAYLKGVCKRLGIIHVTRKDKKDAKAGNINNALKNADGEICVVMDPDHVPHPDFIDRVLPYFENPEIGYVQVVQAYYNQKESLVAFGAAEQTYHFYGPMMMSMNSYGTVQAIGANCTFRREALDSIGGHAAGLAEDMHTSMKLHAKGWKSVYAPEVLSKGLVPASLSAYYKQQLKWSRGCFDLLFYVLPKIFFKLTRRQQFHYTTLPLYFLGGLADMANLFIPIIALVLAEFPWRVDLTEFVLAYTPLFFFTIFIRQYTQRWLLERHEKGFHLIGGLLKIGTWWVHVIGFVYTVFRIKVPYIPTPKDDKPQNEWAIAVPNIIVILISIFAIIYGLKKDWNPYTFVMAGFAMVNVSIMSLAIIMGQQAFLLQIKKIYKGSQREQSLVRPIRIFWWQVRHGIYDGIGKLAPYLGAVSAVLFAYALLFNKVDPEKKFLESNKKTGGFYSGIYVPEAEGSSGYTMDPILSAQNDLNTSFSIVSISQRWHQPFSHSPSDIVLENLQKQGYYPMISWEPWPEDIQDSLQRNILYRINQGEYDDYIVDYALSIRKLNSGVFIRFAPEPDNPALAWSEHYGNSAKQYIKAWQRVVDLFRANGVSNVAWVWNPWKDKCMERYYPGDKYVDWIGVSCLNYGAAFPGQEWKDFEDIYVPFRHRVLANKSMSDKPVLLTQFGTTDYGGIKEEWMLKAFEKIIHKFTEVKGLVFYYTKEERCWRTEWQADSNTVCIDWSFHGFDQVEGFSLKPIMSSSGQFENKFVKYSEEPRTSLSNKKDSCCSIKNDKGKFEFLVDGEPFYVKGVVYNNG